MHFGIREHAMGSIMNGIKVHGGTRPYGGTFLTFSDYMRPPVRLAALMRIPVTFVWTHDSIGLGEDGPTHQPIEHISALRTIPGFDVVRPTDANETAACWVQILRNTDRPAGLLLSRQALPIVPRGADGFADTSEVAKGAYILKDSRRATPDVILVGTGSEVQYAVAAAEAARRRGHRAPGWCRCRAGSGSTSRTRSTATRSSRRTSRRGSASRPGSAGGWRDIVGDAGRIISINHYGASAAATILFQEFGFSADTVAAAAKESIQAASLEGAPVHAGRERTEVHGGPGGEPRRHHQLIGCRTTTG